MFTSYPMFNERVLKKSVEHVFMTNYSSFTLEPPLLTKRNIQYAVNRYKCLTKV